MGPCRLSKCEGSYQITVFTTPTPFRAGPVDISVLVQDAATGELDSKARVTVGLTPRDRYGQPMRLAAATEAATNKLFRAAIFDLPEAGQWEVEVAIEGGQGSAQVRFDVAAARRLPQWPAMWPWIGWPLVVVVFFSIHQFLIWRKALQS